MPFFFPAHNFTIGLHPRKINTLQQEVAMRLEKINDVLGTANRENAES
jgi:hypothetical protein